MQYNFANDWVKYPLYYFVVVSVYNYDSESRVGCWRVENIFISWLNTKYIGYCPQIKPSLLTGVWPYPNFFLTSQPTNIQGPDIMNNSFYEGVVLSLEYESHQSFLSLVIVPPNSTGKLSLRLQISDPASLSFSGKTWYAKSRLAFFLRAPTKPSAPLFIILSTAHNCMSQPQCHVWKDAGILSWLCYCCWQCVLGTYLLKGRINEWVVRAGALKC